MEWMDLLFKRYANPFIFLDELIANGRFFEYVIELQKIINKEESWDFYLHKVFDKTYEEFLDAVEMSNTPNPDIDFTATINTSYDILQGFNPNEQQN